MNNQRVDCGGFCMHRKFKDMPAALYGRDVARVYIFFDLIDGFSSLSCNLESCAVMAFVDVLVDIFDGFDRSTNLHIDVTVCKSHHQY
jgi:hypothetical protein